MNNEQNNSVNNSITPYTTYLMVWVSLLALTGITVIISGFDLGLLALFSTMLIALIQATVIIKTFMHIRFQEPIFKFFLTISVLALLVVFIYLF